MKPRVIKRPITSEGSSLSCSCCVPLTLQTHRKTIECSYTHSLLPSSLAEKKKKIGEKLNGRVNRKMQVLSKKE